MTTINHIIAIFAIGTISLGALIPFGTLLDVYGELNTNDFEHSIHITDLIPYYTYQGISKVLSNGDQSFEDQDVIRLIIQDSNYYAVYNNGHDNTFVFAGIYENGA